jgi:hypothetical protein
VAQLLEADFEDRLAGGHEPLVARHVRGAEARHLGPHRGRVARVLEHLAVVEPDPVERRDRPQLDVVGESAATQLPELLEEERGGDDGRPGVEGEAVLPVDVGPPAGGVELLQDRHPVAAGAQPHSRREPAEAASDDDGVRPAPPTGGRRWRSGRSV